MKDKNSVTSNQAGKSDKVLIPVDFSAKGSIAIQVGFELARRLSKDVTLLHASTLINPTEYPQFPDDFYGIDIENEEIEEMELGEEVKEIDANSFHRLILKIKKLQKEKQIPDIQFDTVMWPGMPEEVISEYCSQNSPDIIVMATRGCNKIREELVGSVTGEVIDHCIAPVFAVPECYTYSGFKGIVRICAFCYCDEGDIKAISFLMEMFDNPSITLYLFPATEKMKNQELQKYMDSLISKLSERYPNSRFLYINDSSKNLRESAESLFKEENIQMILAPNRKRSAIARFFNPGLAHRILFEIDFPLFAIPV